MGKKLFNFYCNCVGWPSNDVHAPGGLVEMIHHPEEMQVSRATFLRHVNRSDLRELEQGLGYTIHRERGLLSMARDWHVSYHRSKLHGKTAYFFKHSAIEYVFTA